jgi:hypothetical protein
MAKARPIECLVVVSGRGHARSHHLATRLRLSWGTAAVAAVGGENNFDTTIVEAMPTTPPGELKHCAHIARSANAAVET